MSAKPLEKEQPEPAFAHSANAAGRWHPLREHLRAVGDLAFEFARSANWAREAKLAGLLHDLGKYGARFQARLKGLDQGLDHWSQGASVALTRYRAVAAALAAQGHHIGLQRGDRASLRRLLPENLPGSILHGLALSDPNVERLHACALGDGLDFAAPTGQAFADLTHAVAAMLDIRLLFSCLVDADFLDTEAHFEGDRNGKHYRPRSPDLKLNEALDLLTDHVSRVSAASGADPSVRRSREFLWESIGKSAAAGPGAFTLTAPTGAGKTLAMLRFALAHAVHNGQRRVVLAVPYLSIIEQTASVYRSVFADYPENFVLEHHSLAGLGAEHCTTDTETGSERQRRLLSENWDAPIVLTTNVQLLESLFSNKPSACRKLHNLMDSVILFDEAQSLPAGLAVPTLAAVSHLATAYRSSVVFATATQPAFDTLHDEVSRHAVSGWRPAEAVPEHSRLFQSLKRTVVNWPTDGEQITWEDIASFVRQDAQVLVVVNLKRHALGLVSKLQGVDGLYHLSTNLCAEHRTSILAQVRSRLAAGLPCRLVSTQCVEAGVDIDFPVVYRAMAPLESIAQAAGRCNREGRGAAPGKVVVFEPSEDHTWRRLYPTHAYYQATEVTRSMLRAGPGLDIGDPQVFRSYYRRLYDVSQPANHNAELMQAIEALDFVEVARLYRLIEQDSIQVLVPWSKRIGEVSRLRTAADREGISAKWIREARGLAVSVYRATNAPPAWAVPMRMRKGEPSDEWFALEGDIYDEVLGLNPPQGEQVFIA